MNLKWATLKEIFEVKLCNTVLSKDVIISYILRNSDIKKLSFIFHNYYVLVTVENSYVQ